MIQDLVSVGGLSNLRQQLMDMKETVLETCVAELKNAVVGKKMKNNCTCLVIFSANEERCHFNKLTH